ncbi:hypothetical protein [Streptomyces sp. NPDC007883]|uniref:hypothetical protein n=1 Tax=Streptomyces sp. NPDC007883 TaxID=3155116 RepID=UPI0033C51433
MLGTPVDLGELILGVGEADLESCDLAEPAFALGFGDAGVRLSRISTRRSRWAGSGQNIGQRTQACSWMQGVLNERPQVPMETLRRSRWPRNSIHSSSVGTRCSSVGRMARRRARKARWAWTASSGWTALAVGDVDVLVSGDDLGDVRGQAAEGGVGDGQLRDGSGPRPCAQQHRHPPLLLTDLDLSRERLVVRRPRRRHIVYLDELTYAAPPRGFVNVTAAGRSQPFRIC